MWVNISKTKQFAHLGIMLFIYMAWRQMWVNISKTKQFAHLGIMLFIYMACRQMWVNIRQLQATLPLLHTTRSSSSGWASQK